MRSLRRSTLLTAVAAALALTSFHAALAAGDDDAEPTAEPGRGDSGAGGADATEGEGESTGAPAADTTPAPGGDLDVDALRQEYLKLRDQLFRSRARAATVATALYSTRVSIALDYTSARFYDVGRATIRLDGANVYDNTSGAIATGKAGAPRFEGFIAPGRHVVTMRIEATGKDDQRFTSTVESSFVVEAVAGKDLEIKAKARDGGNIPFRWKKSESGTYELHLDVKVKTHKRGHQSDRIQRASN